MSLSRKLSIYALLAVFTVSAGAQASAQDASSTITVTGQKLEKKEAKRQSRSFVGQTTVTSFSQYARRNRRIRADHPELPRASADLDAEPVLELTQV